MTWSTLAIQLCAAAASQAEGLNGDEPLPGRFAGKGIVIGLEYAVVNNQPLVHEMSRALAETGMTGMKHFPDAVEWGDMQKGPDQKIDYTRLDWFVNEYQQSGFTELTLCLKPHCTWGSVDVPPLGKYTDPSPKPEYRRLFEKWIQSVVERYDRDGVADMPGLRWPVRYLEIGSEFSSYEPEPVDAYLNTLGMAFRAAHNAYPAVRVGHAAFLITPVDLDVKNPADYDRVWAETKHPDPSHDLADQRAILDHPELFDFINIHNLGWPYEIEDILRWLRYETRRRGYSRPVVVSDTVPTSYIGWGPATTCTAKPLGYVCKPAVEADRCRLADFFKKLVNKDAASLAWTRGFVAADHTKRAVVAAEQGVKLINLSFTGDITLATMPFFQAAAGISAWGGALRVDAFTGAVLERYPLFYAIRQLMGYLKSGSTVSRVKYADDRIRVYMIRAAGRRSWVAWFNPNKALLPEDGQPAITVSLATGAAKVTIEPVITTMGQTEPDRRVVATKNSAVRLSLTHTPVYVTGGE
ncbi:MAG: hypothetical protein AB1714_03880 [Acidobacteriota bacterium]